QAAYALTKMLGIDQKMAIIDLGREDSYREEDPLSVVIQEAWLQDKIIESEIEPAEKWLDSHNRFLQKLYYSYKVDVRFRKEIDSLRAKTLSHIKPAEGESFRFIAGNAVTAFALEFAVRTGKKPLIANPYITDHFASLINDDPYYSMSHSELYRKYRDRFKERHYLLFDSNIINDWLGRPELIGGTRYLKSALRTIFTYNEIITFLSDEKDKKAANPSIEPYQTTRFSLPGADFTRPGEEEAFSSMSSAQLFQAVEGCSQKKWDRHRDNILNRYSYLAVRGEIKPDAFMKHISKLAEKDFHIALDKDKKSGNEDHGYYIKRAEMTRTVIETVLRYSKPDFLDDEFLVNYYSEADEIKDDGAFIYFKRNYFGSKIPGQISQSQAINGLVGDYDHPGPMDAFPLHALAMIMDISPQRIGQKMMNFFVAMTEAAEDRFDLYTGDENMWYEGSYGVAPVLGIPFDAFNEHPEYYAKLLLKSSLSPELLEFLIRPETAPQSTNIFSSSLEFGEREKEFGSFLSEIMLQEMIRQNSVEGNEFKLLKTIIGDSPKIASDVIIKLWRRFDVDELNSLLGLGAKVTDSHLERMEVLFTEQNLNNRAVALFLTIYPDFDIELAKRLDRLFQDDSVQVTIGLLRAVRSRQWTGEEVNALYRTNLWSFTSPNVRHRNLQQILKLSKENKNKFFIAFSGKELKPQNVSDIYPLNIPDNHALYGQYRHELKAYSMDFSSFVRDEIRPESKESEEGVRRRAIHRSRLLFNDLEAVLRLPQEELSRRVVLLQDFETNSTELDNTAYRLLMVIPKEHFDELCGILKDNFASLKNLKLAKRQMTARFQEIVKLNPELKDYTQKTIIRWAAEQLGITSRRRFTESSAAQNIKRAFYSKLAENDLGRVVTMDRAGEEENKRFMTLSAANKLLLTIAENLRFYKSWLDEIPDVETDPGRMLPTAVTQGL
ncbi:MAG: hypothetical protein Q8N76_00530, partial [Candidatus Omnitrophota bacterium]|nr:hypothetical protein [Candidatus Omnitrophota bacterium]